MKTKLLLVGFFSIFILMFNSNASAADVTLKWERSNTGNVDGYNIHYGTAPKKYTRKIDVGNVIEYTISGLNPDWTYYLAVSAYNEHGESGFSNEVKFQLSDLKYSNLTYSPVVPCRIVDTRLADGAIVPGEIRDYNTEGSVVSQGGKASGCPAPSGNPYSVVLNVTAVPVTGSGNLKVFPYGYWPPDASLVNYKTGVQNLANSTTVKTCHDCAHDISIQSNYGTAHVVVDVVGYYYPDGGLKFSPVEPCRIVDTRKAGGALSPGQVRSYYARGSVSSQGGNPDGCPAPAGDAEGLVVNVTAVPESGSGNIKVFPHDSSPPDTSLINYKTGAQVIANATTIGSCYNCGQDFDIQNSYGNTHVTIDVMGYYYPDGDLVFSPVEPCRIVDTRKAGGALSPGQIRSYYARGSVSSQGGNPDGCPAPAGEADGLVVNITAVPVSGSGNIKVFPYDASPPDTSLVNYEAGVQVIANATTVGSCYGCGKDVAIQNSYGTSHVIIDVMGYYYKSP